jgi:transposase
LECSGCGRKFADADDSNERAVRDLPWSKFRTTVHIEVYRVNVVRKNGSKVKHFAVVKNIGEWKGALDSMASREEAGRGGDGGRRARGGAERTG